MKYKIINTRCIALAICVFIFTACISQTNKRTKTAEVESPKVKSKTREKNMQTDYNPIPLTRLIGMAELMVTGTVTVVKDSSFTFQVSEFIVGKEPSNTIEVKKYMPDVFFEPRSLPYMKQQRFALFLQKPKQQNGSELWNILGYAGEGELPIDEGFVYLEGMQLEGLTKNTYDVHGIKRTLQRYELSGFKDALKHYGNCFSWELETYTKNNKKRERWVAIKSCDDNTLKGYRSRSWLHDYLAMKTLNKIQKNSND